MVKSESHGELKCRDRPHSMRQKISVCPNCNMRAPVKQALRKKQPFEYPVPSLRSGNIRLQNCARHQKQLGYLSVMGEVEPE